MLFSRALTRTANPLSSRTLHRTISTTTTRLATNMKPIQVYTFGTPNGWPVTAALHELKAGNPSQNLQWESHSIDIMKNIQKEPWFLKINPNGRIPAIVDPNHTSEEHPEGFPVWETSAILLYLEKRYDPGHVLSWGSEEVSPDKADELRSEVLQWMFFAHGGVGPMQGQANHFRMQAVGDSKNVIPYALNRYLNETKRLYEVLDSRLQGRDYLVGPGRGKFSLADLKAVTWVFAHPFAGIPRKDLPENVRRWLDTCKKRDAFQKGLRDPEEGFLVKSITADENWVAEMPQL